MSAAETYNYSNIVVYNIDGTTSSLSDYSEELVALFYGSAERCQNTLAMLSVAERAVERGVSIRPILMDLDSDTDTLQSYAQEHPLVTVAHRDHVYNAQYWQFHNASDPGILPLVIIYDKTGNIVYQSQALETEKLREFLGGQNATVEISFPVTFHQSEARSELAMVNEFRTGNDAWYWNEDNATKTTLTGLGNLTYDYELEKIAMQRAVEIAIYFSHTRADGKECFQTYSDYNYGAYSIGENIAYGHIDAKMVFEAWQETDENYSGQGHRRNMLYSGYTTCGFACARCNGINYWVQIFANPFSMAGTEAVTAANDSTSVETARISTDYITGFSRDDLTLTEGDTKNVSEMPVYMNYSLDGNRKIKIAATPTSSKFSADGDISMQDGIIYANSPGKATWTETYDIGGSQTVTSTITVKAAPVDENSSGDSTEKPSDSVQEPNDTMKPDQPKEPQNQNTDQTQNTNNTGNTEDTKKPDNTRRNKTILFINTAKGTAVVPDYVVEEYVEVPLAVVLEGAVYRMYNPNSGEHFYTKSSAERDALIGSGWNYEENASFATIAADEEGAQAVYRVYNPHSGLHHYTMSYMEAFWLWLIGWDYEGISFYAFDTDSGIGSPQYRVYNPNDGQHHWTVDANEKNYLVGIGWNDEGVAWNVK